MGPTLYYPVASPMAPDMVFLAYRAPLGEVINFFFFLLNLLILETDNEGIFLFCFVFFQRGCLALKQHLSPVGVEISVSVRRWEA